MTADDIDNVADRFVRNVLCAMQGQSVRELAKRSGITKRRLQAILEGRRYPDLADIRALENTLDADLWPWPHG